MSTAFLFPGQGAERPGMGLDLAARSPAARALLERAGASAGVDALRVLGRGGPDLRRTEVIQPLLVATCLGFAEALREAGITPAAVAGHSLGELAAWAGAGGIDPGVAVDLAAARGRLMAREAARFPGGLVALPDADEAMLARAIEAGRRAGAIVIAAENAPRQWVLSGDEPALRAVLATCAATRLPAVGAWHGPAMIGAAEELGAVLHAASRSSIRATFVGGAAGEAIPEEAIPRAIADQLARPVRWVAVLGALARAGATRFVTVGPGKVLRALVRQTLGESFEVHTTEDVDDLDRTRRSLGA